MNRIGEWLSRIFGAEEKEPEIQPFDGELPPDFHAKSRKARTEAVLVKLGVPINHHLPRIEDESEIQLRSPEEVFARFSALMICALRADGLLSEPSPQVVDGKIRETIERRQLAGHFSPDETAYLAEVSPTQHQSVQFVWRYEAALPLAWALGRWDDELGLPDQIVDLPRLVELFNTTSDWQNPKLRDVSEILDQADLIYRLHWACRNARLADEEAPVGLDYGVVMERHKALNWLVGYCGLDWDDVTTDT